jgi:peptidoglycan/xylan/chitin deacetylase (PgdA/CDA1 family)
MNSRLDGNQSMEMTNQSLWSSNTPANFWLCQPNPSEDLWQDAIRKSIPLLGLGEEKCDIESVLAATLGEGRFGTDHWELGSLKRVYYLVKPLVPRMLARQLRRIYNRRVQTRRNWPIEQYYVNFLWEVLRQVLILSDRKELTIRYFWPDHARFAFVLTHDIETSAGQEFVEAVADLEESLGFHSLFNFVPERYQLNYRLMDNLRQRGFEIGVHGLRHNGRLFDSRSRFMQNAKRINGYLKEWNATGFRAELTLRQPEWMQALDIEYDLSFFDTDPFEPIPGGTMSIWPFSIGHFIELPYTLVQDHTLTSILGETSPRIWLEKVDFIERYHGMALVNTHPDYLKSKLTWGVYYEFLNEMKERDSYWHALPGEVARWWRTRSTPVDAMCQSFPMAQVTFADGDIHIEIPFESEKIPIQL